MFSHHHRIRHGLGVCDDCVCSCGSISTHLPYIVTLPASWMPRGPCAEDPPRLPHSNYGMYTLVPALSHPSAAWPCLAVPWCCHACCPAVARPYVAVGLLIFPAWAAACTAVTAAYLCAAVSIGKSVNSRQLTGAWRLCSDSLWWASSADMHVICFLPGPIRSAWSDSKIANLFLFCNTRIFTWF
jgi:hypothetical protein